MACVANTARPAFGVWRISKMGDTGAPKGSSLVDSVGGAEEADEGREMLMALWSEPREEGLLMGVSMFAAMGSGCVVRVAIV
jgi:hypothetical protein